MFNSAMKRIKRLTGRYARVDGISYQLPINSKNSPALMSLYSIDAEKAKAILVSDELHPLRLLNGRGVLVFTIIDYRETDIGKYIEYSIAIACTQGTKPAPRLLPALLMKTFQTGQCVIDLPVSTEISVKGGRGIWGMPKHQQSLNFIVKDDIVSAQYDLDGELAVKVVIPKPTSYWVPLNIGAINYCAFRGMLMKSYIYFKTKLGFTLGRRNEQEAKLIVGNHPRVRWLKEIDVADSPFMTAFLPNFEGILDDHLECWFLSSATPIEGVPEGLEMTHPLGYGEEWPPSPEGTDAERDSVATGGAAKPVGITFSELMAGGVMLGEMDPQAGAKAGRSSGNILAMRASIRIDDIDEFVANPTHGGQISGTVDFTPFGKGLPTTRGVFNLFSPSEDPKMKYMVYELGFRHEGKDFYLAGKKQVKDDPGFDLWSDTTTLYVRLYEGLNADGVQVGAGVLTLAVGELVDMLKTFRAINSPSALETSKALAKFGRFFLGELWDSYAALADDTRKHG